MVQLHKLGFPEEAIKEKWYQDYPWKEGINDRTEDIWNAINIVDWTGLRVLDIGCNLGYYSFKAKQAGANYVLGIDHTKRFVDWCILIRDNIEILDVEFQHQTLRIRDSVPEGFDVIFYMSMHHQKDPGYKYLEDRVNRQLKNACKHLFIELILPPLFGKLYTTEQLDSLVDGKELLTYPNASRGTRRLWHWSKNE